MLDRVVDFAVRWRKVVLGHALAVLVLGVFAARMLPIDAVPDVTNVQVQVLTNAQGLSAEEMEQFVTRPVETGLNGVPHLAEIRSITREGVSTVTVVFDESVDVWFARQLVMERLREIEADIPPQFGRPEMAPVSTGLGEIYQFVVKGDGRTPMELRTLLDWEVSPRLRSVPGVIEVNAFGGAKKQYQVVLDPARLAAHRVTLAQVFQSLERNNVNVGGGYVERGAEQFVIRGEGQLRSEDDIARTVVAVGPNGTPVQVRHLGEVRTGAALPLGVVTQDGRGEVVAGIVYMLAGENSRTVVHAVHAKIDEIQRDLPRGVRIETVYDRAQFINRTLRTVAVNLLEGALLVAVVLLVFLGSARGAALVTAGIPFAMSLAIFGMLALGITGNLMSLGAIDFGFLVDGPIVMLEAAIARLALEGVTKENAARSVADAIRSVARPVVFSVAIVLLVYLPLLALQGVEGKMFRPMAITMALALGGSLLFALLVFPAGAVTFLKPPKEPGHHGLLAKLEAPYGRAVAWAVRKRGSLLLGACALLAAVAPVAAGLGADFVPRIDEGDIYVSIRRMPSVGITEARRLDLECERVLGRFPEVLTTLATTGRAEVALDPVGMDNTDILAHLRPRAEWTTAHDLDALGEAMKQAIEREVPSSFVSISQPIEDRTNEMISGSRADVVAYLGGDDLVTMTDISSRIAQLLRRIPGAGDVRLERALGLPMLNVRVDRDRLARHGIAAEDALAAVEATRIGRPAGFVFEGARRFDLRVFLPPTDRRAETLGRLPIGTHQGELIPLSQVADITEADGAAQIGREALRRRMRVEVNLRGRDLVSFVDEARAVVGREVRLPEGYTLDWAGQFENLRRAKERLAVVVPLALAIILGMLFFTFGNLRYALAVFTGVPFALLGGVVALKARGMSFSLPAAVGFIALCGIAVLNGVVMASEIRERLKKGASQEEAIAAGAVTVLRPLLLTATVAALGFAPMAVSTSAGSEVQQPLATVVIGGLASSTLLGVFLLPALLRMFNVAAAEAQGEEGGA
ncbi:MAG: CusA/CzcA family heavy metal efflux RND transporter [Polyangiales bacterium]